MKGCVAEKDGCIDHISKADLAELTAMSRESGIRVLKDFKDEGYITIDGHKISILDEVNLRNIAQFG